MYPPRPVASPLTLPSPRKRGEGITPRVAAARRSKSRIAPSPRLRGEGRDEGRARPPGQSPRPSPCPLPASGARVLRASRRARTRSPLPLLPACGEKAGMRGGREAAEANRLAPHPALSPLKRGEGITPRVAAARSTEARRVLLPACGEKAGMRGGETIRRGQGPRPL